MALASRSLIRWSQLHDRRAREGRWWATPLVIAIASGAALAGWVWWRGFAGPAAASHAWLAGSLAAFALAFLRVPFLVYWRPDAALLAQLPIEGTVLFDAAVWRCAGAARTTMVAALIGALPFVAISPELAARHAAVALTLGACAAGFLPAVAIWAASLVALDRGDAGTRAVLAVTALAAGRPDQAVRAAGGPAAPSAILGALPGFAATAVVVLVVIVAPSLVGEPTSLPPVIVLAAMAGGSALAIVAVRALAGGAMGVILRDVSALDRQRLAKLEIHPPTPLERAIAELLGDAALVYRKDVRLVRRRYPMAFALGALVFVVLGIIGLARPIDPAPWLTATFVGATAYGLALVGRLGRAPIELPRLAPTLPISAASRARARLAWTLDWWLIYVGVPGVFAALRQPDAIAGLALLGGSGVLVIGAAAREMLRA